MACVTVPTKYRLPADLRNEIRRTLSLKGLAHVYSKTQMTQKSIGSLMEDIYHGNESKGIHSHVDQFVKGGRPFTDMFDVVNDAITDNMSTASSVSSVSRFVLKSELLQSDTPYQAGRDITKEVLERTAFKKGSPLISGRTLFKLANNSLRTIRKAISIAVQLVDSEGQPKHSGTSLDDVKALVLDEMYMMMKGKCSLDDCFDDDNVADEDDTAVVHDKRPEGWFFHGWMAFLLYGPLAPVCNRMALLETAISIGSESNKKDSGRSAHRKTDGDEKKAERSRGTVDGKRGMTTGERISLANLELRHSEQQQSKKETQLIAMNMNVKNMMQAAQMAQNLAVLMCPDIDPTNVYWIKVADLTKKVSEMCDGVTAFAAPSPVKKNAKKLMVIDLLGSDNDENKTPKKRKITEVLGANDEDNQLDVVEAPITEVSLCFPGSSNSSITAGKSDLSLTPTVTNNSLLSIAQSMVSLM
jgi:hypothetical protein